MKKLSKVAAIIASLALLFGAVSCSSDDSDDSPAPGGSGSSNPPAVTFTPKTHTFTQDEITNAATLLEVAGVNGIDEVVSKDITIVTVAQDGLSITSVKAGSTTVEISGNSKTVEVPITVDEDGSITVGTAALKAGGTIPTPPPAGTGTVWTFDNETQETLRVGKEFTPDSGSAATLKVTMAADLKTATVSNTSTDVYIQAGKNSKEWGEYKEKAKGQLTLVLTKASTIEMICSNSGSDPQYRWVVITSGDTVVSPDEFKAMSSQVTKSFELNAGTYIIYMNGSRLHSLTVN